MTDDLRARLRKKALRAAQTVTISLALGGCYAVHDMPQVDAEVRAHDAGRFELPDGGRPPDAGHDAGHDAGQDAGQDGGVVPFDAGACIPDPDCNGPWDGSGDEVCDWDQHNICCDELGWSIDPCFLPGGPLAPPEMPRTLTR